MFQNYQDQAELRKSPKMRYADAVTDAGEKTSQINPINTFQKMINDRMSMRSSAMVTSNHMNDNILSDKCSDTMIA